MIYNINIYFCVMYYIYNIMLYSCLMIIIIFHLKRKRKKEETEKTEHQSLKKWLVNL